VDSDGTVCSAGPGGGSRADPEVEREVIAGPGRNAGIGQVELLGLSPTRLRVAEEHRVAGARRPLKWDVDPEGRSRCEEHEPQAHHNHAGCTT